MTNLKISPNFTVEDIHKIRVYNFEMTKNMTLEERNAYYNEKAQRAMNRITEIKTQKAQMKATNN